MHVDKRTNLSTEYIWRRSYDSGCQTLCLVIEITQHPRAFRIWKFKRSVLTARTNQQLPVAAGTCGRCGADDSRAQASTRSGSVVVPPWSAFRTLRPNMPKDAAVVTDRRIWNLKLRIYFFKFHAWVYSDRNRLKKYYKSPVDGDFA